MRTYVARCHCGNIELTYSTALPPSELPVRSCQCTFCRRHRARTSTDPAGRVGVRIHDEGRLSRYQFGLRLAEMLVCATCGCYAGALYRSGENLFAVVNLNLIDDPELNERTGKPVSYDGESAAERGARRERLWTPAAMVAS
jgi:hypothetical protein